jgi:hypothetical protein
VTGEARLKLMAIEALKNAKKGLRPSGRIRFLFCLQQNVYPRVGYVEEKRL